MLFVYTKNKTKFCTGQKNRSFQTMFRSHTTNEIIFIIEKTIPWIFACSRDYGFIDNSRLWNSSVAIRCGPMCVYVMLSARAIKSEYNALKCLFVCTCIRCMKTKAKGPPFRINRFIKSFSRGINRWFVYLIFPFFMRSFVIFFHFF